MARTTAGSVAAAGGVHAAPAPDAEVRPAYDWGRLERAVAALVSQHASFRSELSTLRADLKERDHRIRRLEAQLIESNQRRQDTAKRIDELISQLDQLDAQLASSESTE